MFSLPSPNAKEVNGQVCLVCEGFYLYMQRAVIGGGLSTTDIWAVALQSRDTVLDGLLKHHTLHQSVSLSIY